VVKIGMGDNQLGDGEVGLGDKVIWCVIAWRYCVWAGLLVPLCVALFWRSPY
jgi:hypothetical protein